MDYTPKKVFILGNHGYIEYSYQEFCKLQETEESYKDKYFLQLYGMLLEVSRAAYVEYYKKRRRQRYLDEQSQKNGDISYDMLTANGYGSKNIPVSGEDPVQELVERKMMIEKLCMCISDLTADEKKLLEGLFVQGLSERKWSEITGIPQKTVNDRKRRILEKLRKLMEE